MAKTSKLSLGRVLIQLALAVIFFFDGLFLLGFKGVFLVEVMQETSKL